MRCVIVNVPSEKDQNGACYAKIKVCGMSHLLSWAPAEWNPVRGKNFGTNVCGSHIKLENINFE